LTPALLKEEAEKETEKKQKSVPHRLLNKEVDCCHK